MRDVQKQTYLKIIMSKVYSEDAFCAKSVTLDFMYQFNNPCVAMLSLTDILNYDGCIAKIGLKCIYGIVLAVEEYFKYMQKVIMSNFTRTLIDGMAHKIDDTFIDDYENCMINIMQFVSQNAEINLLYPFLELVRSFEFSNLDNDKTKKVYDVFCQCLKHICHRLMNENKKLFIYRLTGIKCRYEHYRNDDRLWDFIKLLDEFSNESDNQIYFLSNNSDKSAELELRLSKEFEGKIQTLQKYEIDDFKFERCKVIFILDFEQEDAEEMLYYLGKLEGILGTHDTFLAVFYNCSAQQVKTSPGIRKLVDRYIQADEYKKIVNFIKR